MSERLAVNIAVCLTNLFLRSPQEIVVSPVWLCDVHQQLTGNLFPEWSGQFRSVEVQVGTHMPPPPRSIAELVQNFCLDLEERVKHAHSVASLAELLAWVDWRFQWIHPFKDFNGRVGRILLVTLCYRIGLPPIDPAAAEADRAGYFDALHSADNGDIGSLAAIWIKRIENFK